MCVLFVGGGVGLRVGFINIKDMYNNHAVRRECGFMSSRVSKIKGGAC